MESGGDSFLNDRERSRPRYRTIAVVALIHIIVIFGLIRAFTPNIISKVTQSVLSSLTVTVATQPSKPPEPPKAADKSGEAAAIGKKAVPKEAKAPKPKVEIAKANAPVAASTGSSNTSGAANSAAGTGAGGQGDGTGSGSGGNGQGGGAPRKPSVRSGELNQARDFPVPDGGRQSRFGKSVTVHFTVTTDGQARDCSVAKSDVDAATTAQVCPLVMRKIRFNPAQRGDGSVVEARYGYRVDFKPM